MTNSILMFGMGMVLGVVIMQYASNRLIDRVYSDGVILARLTTDKLLDQYKEQLPKEPFTALSGLVLLEEFCKKLKERFK